MTALFRRFLYAGILVILILVPAASLVNAEDAYEEGIHLAFAEMHHRSTDAVIHAVKHVDGDWRQTEITFTYHYAYVDGKRDIEGTVILEGDPDWLEVSEDLGWGGLDATVMMQQRRSDCGFSTGSYVCGPEIVEMVPVTFHISQVANAGYQEEDGYFTRRATVRGTVTIGSRVHYLDFGRGLQTAGYNFSDQYPG